MIKARSSNTMRVAGVLALAIFTLAVSPSSLLGQVRLASRFGEAPRGRRASHRSRYCGSTAWVG